MRYWLVRLAAGYAGLTALTFFLYRQAYQQSRELRDWTDRWNGEILATLDQMRDELRSRRLVYHSSTNGTAE